MVQTVLMARFGLEFLIGGEFSVRKITIVELNLVNIYELRPLNNSLKR